MTAPARRAVRPRSVFFEVFALGQAVGELLSQAMADGPLTPNEYAVYSVVFDAEAITPSAMATALGVPLTTVMERVRELETRGHARRIPNPRDGRSYLLTLTASGLAAHRAANRRFESAYQSFIAQLDVDETRALRSLQRLRTAVERAQSAPTALPSPGHPVPASHIAPNLPSRALRKP